MLCSLTHTGVSNETRQGSQGFQCVVHFCDTTFELTSRQLVEAGKEHGNCKNWLARARSDHLHADGEARALGAAALVRLVCREPQETRALLLIAALGAVAPARAGGGGVLVADGFGGSGGSSLTAYSRHRRGHELEDKGVGMAGRQGLEIDVVVFVSHHHHHDVKKVLQHTLTGTGAPSPWKSTPSPLSLSFSLSLSLLSLSLSPFFISLSLSVSVSVCLCLCLFLPRCCSVSMTLPEIEICCLF